MHTKFYSQANQDQFVFNILNQKLNGTFIDIGSNNPIIYNNSFFLESVGWSGICIDIENFDYSNRKCKFYNANALSINYSSLFLSNNLPHIIDYLSIDIDDNTANCLELIPLHNYYFKVITIEHDSYRLGNSLQIKEHSILYNNGYFPLCKNITFQHLKPTEFFEDWWIHPNYINIPKYNYLASNKESSENIIKKFPNPL